MSDSPPPSPTLSIQIDTPPDSPCEQFKSTPLSIKRDRTRSTYLEPTPTKRQRQFTGPTTRTSRCADWEAQLPEQQHPGSFELPDVSLNVESAIDPEPIERNINDDAYLHYVDLALVDGIGIYQISQTIFVVQGWDSRSMSGTVSI